MRYIVLLAAILSITLFSSPMSAQSPDFSTLRWESRADMPTARAEMAAAVLEGKIYVVGGFITESNGLGITGALEVYDPSTDEWEVLTPLPQARHHVMAIGYEGKLYVFGGAKNLQFQASEQVYVYDPVTDNWEQRDDMPMPRMSGSAVVLDEHIYIVGGVDFIQDNGGFTATPLLRYEPVSDRWEILATTTEVRDHSLAVVLEGNIYTLAGRNNVLGDHNTIEIYNPETDTWTFGVAMNDKRGGFGATVIEGQIFVGGGEIFVNGQADLVKSTEIFDPTANQWIYGPELPLGIHGVPATSLDGVIYFFGGATEFSLRDTILALNTVS